MNRPLKRSLAACLIAVTLFTAAFSAFAFYFVKEAYQQEINTVINIAGAVLPENSNAEQPFLAAVKGETDAYETGSTILGKYGYNEHMRLLENSGYKKTVIILFAVTWGLWAVLTLFILVFFISIKRRQSRQEKSIAQVLEGYFSDDFSFLKDAEKQRLLLNQQFADTLFKLGRNLEHKSFLLAEEKNNTKSLVTDISHQLKTPIAALSTCLTVLSEADSQEQKTEFLARSLLQVDKLRLLADALMNVSRLETGMISLQKERVNLSDLLVRAVNGIYDKSMKKNIAIETSDFKDLNLNLDPKWTAEAIMNVLDNALKYSPKNSKISIHVQPLYSFVRVEITDCGIGIEKSEQNKIFRRFYRGMAPEVKNSEGSGIGLYLTRRILEEQGGTISVKSEPGKGAAFILQLPL